MFTGTAKQTLTYVYGHGVFVRSAQDRLTAGGRGEGRGQGVDVLPVARAHAAAAVGVVDRQRRTTRVTSSTTLPGQLK